MYSYNARIRYSELDSKLNLSLGSLVNYFQDCSTYHSDLLGVGNAYLHTKNKAWIIAYWQIDIFERTNGFENICVSSWPYKFDAVLGYRNYSLARQDGTMLAVANSMWTLVDTTTNKPSKITNEFSDAYELSAPYDMDYLPRKIKCPSAEYESLDTVPVVSVHIDHNNHMNNAKYLSIAEFFVPNDFTYNRVRCEYRKSAVYKDVIYPKRAIVDNKCYILLCDNNDEEYAIIEFSTF